ncbi:MAG: UDP-3-O-(3-hydroxymyristoyl)glucosamine N-acyltransferase [Gemmataceae bacterium]
MQLTLSEVATWIGGVVDGDGTTPIAGARSITEAGATDLTFVEDDRHWNEWNQSLAAAAIMPVKLPSTLKPTIRVAEPLMAFVEVVTRLRGRQYRTSRPLIDPTAQIDPTATIGPGVMIGPFAVVGAGSTIGAGTRILSGVAIGRGCQIGTDCTIYPHVVLYDECILGHRVVIHANSVLGADGFGYRTQQGKHVKVPQLGRVEIGDDVEIGACATIDRGTFGATRVGNGTKIDNLVMVAHNCQIGRHNLFVSQVGIAGSTTTGDYVVMAGQVGVADHLHIGDRSQLGAKAGVHKDVPADSRMLGAPATPDREQMRIMMSLEKLPELRKDVKRIKQALHLEDEG